MELVIQKAVELGVKAIIPVQCRYSVVQLTGKKAVERCQRWQKIAESAAKQCGRLVIPEILPIANFSQALEQVPADANIIRCV